MSYANAARNARLSRKLRKAPQAEPARTLARVQAMQRLTGAALAVGCVELPHSRLLLVGGKRAAGCGAYRRTRTPGCGCWICCAALPAVCRRQGAQAGSPTVKQYRIQL